MTESSEKKRKEKKADRRSSNFNSPWNPLILLASFLLCTTIFPLSCKCDLESVPRNQAIQPCNGFHLAPTMRHSVEEEVAWEMFPTKPFNGFY
ncbi:hypothetical protein ACSBR2_038864 [Camellia fascicularis]